MQIREFSRLAERWVFDIETWRDVLATQAQPHRRKRRITGELHHHLLCNWFNLVNRYGLGSCSSTAPARRSACRGTRCRARIRPHRSSSEIVGSVWNELGRPPCSRSPHFSANRPGTRSGSSQPRWRCQRRRFSCSTSIRVSRPTSAMANFPRRCGSNIDLCQCRRRLLGHDVVCSAWPLERWVAVPGQG